jgi:hypothetical protein
MKRVIISDYDNSICSANSLQRPEDDGDTPETSCISNVLYKIDDVQQYIGATNQPLSHCFR